MTYKCPECGESEGLTALASVAVTWHDGEWHRTDPSCPFAVGDNVTVECPHCHCVDDFWDRCNRADFQFANIDSYKAHKAAKLVIEGLAREAGTDPTKKLIFEGFQLYHYSGTNKPDRKGQATP